MTAYDKQLLKEILAGGEPVLMHYDRSPCLNETQVRGVVAQLCRIIREIGKEDSNARHG